MPSGVAVPSGFLRVIKTGAVAALQSAFQMTYPEQDTAGASFTPNISIDYPVNPGAYPGIWVDFEVTMLQIAGLNYIEYLPDGVTPLTRWRFQGYAVFTMVALNSNECDGLYDQLVALTAFAAQSDYASTFRNAIDSNNLVNTTWSYDTVEGRGNSAAPGTPWGTDDVIYERGVALKVIGEFTTDPITQAIVPLREIIITETEEDTGDVNGLSQSITIT
jgi:hypothetical protein